MGMLRDMSWDDLMWWKAYEVVEPFGELRQDFRAASIAAASLNATLLLKGIKPSFTPSDMLLEFKEGPPRKMGLETPQAPPTPPVENWQRMKLNARMHFAASKVDKGKTFKAKPTQRKPGGKRS